MKNMCACVRATSKLHRGLGDTGAAAPVSIPSFDTMRRVTALVPRFLTTCFLFKAGAAKGLESP